MIRECEICHQEFETVKNGHSRKYCFECSPPSLRNSIEGMKHHKTILRQAMKRQAVKIKGGKCSVCGYDKCIEALTFHHRDPSEKEFQASSGNTLPWEVYLKEIDKCDLLCANCHAEIHYSNNIPL